MPNSPDRRGSLRYVLITPARNEERFIRMTAEAVVAQTHAPLRWVIVSDGSTDGTDGIVEEYRRQYPWITLIRMPERRERNFAAKVHCFNVGLDTVKDLPFDVIGSLDADITFGPDYFDFLMGKLSDNPRLGVTGTPFVENGRQYNYLFTNVEHVSGACQLFRRECFEAIGGYQPIRGGGIDWVAVTTARLKGWQTRTFTEKTCLHHRPIGTGSAGKFGALFRHGKKDYYLGGHPLWQVLRCAYQATRPPYIIGGLCLMAGYLSALFQRTKRPIPQELVDFQRAEQMARLRAFVRGRTRSLNL
jgi:poly-beta-1,6-N-acetyl-D-glucosamine synthase